MTRVHELRPCDACGGPIGTVFNVVRVSPAIVDLGAVRSAVGMAMHFGGYSNVADVFSPDSVVKIAADESPDIDWREAWLCMECSNLRDVSLAMALEKAEQAKEARA